MATTPTSGTQNDVLAVIEQQHQQVRSLLQRLSSDPKDDSAYCDLIRMLAVHETAEEIVVYPELRSMGDEGNKVVEARIQEENKGKQGLADLEKTEFGSAEYTKQLKTIADEVEMHASNEEKEVFPLLRKIDADKRAQMARQFELAEKTAPTHPHPHGPSSAVGNLMVGPFVGIADRVRDALSGSPAKK